MWLSKSSAATVLQQGPVDVTSDPGQWVQFTCSVACSHSIDWYVESYVQDITTSCSDTADGMMVCKEVTQPCTSSTSTGYHTERLRVLAKPEIAGTNLTVQCAAISRSAPTASDCPPFLSYSRYALLSGMCVCLHCSVTVLFDCLSGLHSAGVVRTYSTNSYYPLTSYLPFSDTK